MNLELIVSLLLLFKATSSESIEQEESVNEAARSWIPNPCVLPKKQGLCLAAFPRYYFDRTEGKCLRFLYGGCGGNGNNFETIEECSKRCAPGPKRCSLPMDTGPCKAYIPSYYYDAKKGKCLPFIYGGCAGNMNRFKSIEECNQICIQEEPVFKKCGGAKGFCRGLGPCKWDGYYTFDEKTSQCRKTPKCCSHPKEYVFDTLEHCEKHCQEKIQPKKCKTSKYSPLCPDSFCSKEWDGTYVFDKGLSQCIKTSPCCQYPYEETIHDSKEMCERQCQSEIKPKPNKCGTAGQACYLMFCDKKWDGTYIFDKQTSQCKRTYPCCHYNNKEYVYDSKEICERQCQTEIKPKPKKCGNAPVEHVACLVIKFCPGKWDGTYVFDEGTSKCKRTKPCCRYQNKEYVFDTKEICEQQCQAKVEPPKPNYDFCQVDLEKFDCSYIEHPDDEIRCGHNTKLYVHSKEAGKCVQLNKCCLKDDEISDKLFFDERDCKRFCDGEDQPQQPEPPKCQGEDLETCSDWHPSCNHGRNMYVLDKKDQQCKKLKKCCPYGRYLYNNFHVCQCKCHDDCYER